MLYFNNFVLPLFDYGDTIWGDKNNDTLMQRLQVLQNKAAKIILGWPVHSSATDALRTLNWFNLSKRRLYHRCLYVFKCKNGLLKSHLSLITMHDVLQYNNRNARDFRLPAVRTNWGKQRLSFHTVKDWNSLSLDTRNSRSIAHFNSNFFSNN